MFFEILGYLWEQAYISGEIKAPLYPDVVPAIKNWKENGLTIAIYSSGSVPAQKLFFQYTDNTENPDIRDYLSNYYDTINAGMKNDSKSYETIAKDMKIEVGGWMFLSDNVKGTYSVFGT